MQTNANSEDGLMGDRESMLEHECERLRQENAHLKAKLRAREDSTCWDRPIYCGPHADNSGASDTSFTVEAIECRGLTSVTIERE